MRRIASAALATLGLIAALVGAGFMTIWAPESVVSASASAPEAAFIQTEPGVIDLVGSDVTVTVTGDEDADVMLAFGLADDVEDWTEGLPVATVTGLKDWKTLDIAEDGADRWGKHQLLYGGLQQSGSFVFVRHGAQRVSHAVETGLAGKSSIGKPYHH